MKVLMLTWEYPPFIVGGLGMACYGLFKALAELGITIKMILPTKEEVFFEISSLDLADYPLAKKEEEKIISPEPLKFLPYIYQLPEESVYSSLKEILGGIKEVFPLSPKEKVPEEILSRLDLILSSGNSLLAKVKAYTQNVLKLVQKIDFDLIHCHDWLTYPAGLFLKKTTSKPLIAHIHATEFDRALGFGHPVIHEIEYLGLNYSDRIIAVSNYTKNIIIEHYHVASEKVSVVHNAFSAKSEAPQKLKKFKEPVVLFLGRLTPQKGPTFFIDIAKKVIEKGVKARFVIAGTGEMERELMLYANSLGIGTSILFTGFLTREEVEKALSMADIVVMPSVSEPFGIVALEALFFGCALIISKQSGASEVIEKAYKVDYWDIERMAEILFELISNPSKLRELQKEAKEEAKKFSWLEPAQKIKGLYEELLAPK